MSPTPFIRISSHHHPSLSPSSSNRTAPTTSTATTPASVAAPTTTTTTAPSGPMAVPRTHDSVPPPLPPPSYIPEIAEGHDPGWQFANDPNRSDFARPVAVKPGSSLLGGATISNTNPLSSSSKNFWPEKDYHSEGSSPRSIVDARRGSSISTITVTRDHNMSDESLPPVDQDTSSSWGASDGRLHGEKQLEQRTLEESSNSYDKHLLSRIGGPNGRTTPKRLSVSYSPGSFPETSAFHAENDRRNIQLGPLSVPERRSFALDSPSSSRWQPSSGAISPGYAPFWGEHGPTESGRMRSRWGSNGFEDSASHRGSYDQAMFNQEDLMEEGPMSHLHIHDRSPGHDDRHSGAKTGTKRRASSPPTEASREERSSVSSASGQSEVSQRRTAQALSHRDSVPSRVHPSHSSVSSASSFGPRHGSLGSSLGVLSIPSSATSYNSGRVSPGTFSPGYDTELRIGTPYSGSSRANPSLSSTSSQHQRTVSETTQPLTQPVPSGSASHSRNSSISHMQRVFICECCPKKPRKFETEEELRLHESEKQYTCAYCRNRFKNKNEAERHQNSLHLRRHSWSCAALTNIDAAFHPSSTISADVCGYCGEEFANPPKWDVRAEHLNHVHKFGECNPTKKFFRADHFRQHLKHSHAGTSGKWTNHLENACMKDEPMPEKRVSPVAVAMPVAGPSAPPLHIRRVSSAGLDETQQSSTQQEPSPTEEKQ